MIIFEKMYFFNKKWNITMRYYKAFQIAVLLIFNISCLLAQNPQHFTFQSNTGNTGSIVVPMNTATIDGVPLSEGDEIGAFTPAGLCVGAVGMESKYKYWIFCLGQQ